MRIVDIVCECDGAIATAEVGPSAMFFRKNAQEHHKCDVHCKYTVNIYTASEQYDFAGR